LIDLINTLTEVFKGDIIGYEVVGVNKLIIDIKPGAVVDVVQYIHKNLGGIYSTTVGVDARAIDGYLHVIHVFSLDGEKTYVLIRSRLPEDNPKIPSITPVVVGANWGEREVRDLLGVEFVNHPDPRKLIVPDDWPDKVFPLRKEFNYSCRPEGGHTPYKPARSEDVVALPYGPYHPLLHEPEYFELHVKGEVVVDGEYRGFHVHRGIEKLGESRLTYNQIPFVAERICGICGFVHNVCYCQAVEEAARIEVPERAHYIRSLLLEIERLHSHLLWLGVACHVLGFDTGFMHAWRIREPVMNIAELLTGNRKTYGMNLVGGVRRDINDDAKGKVLKIIKNVRDEYIKFVNNLVGVREVIKRLEGSGRLLAGDAISYGVCGPVARGSGVRRDVRVDHPYAAYREVSFNVPVFSEGDNMARLMVRVNEVFETMSIIEQLLDRMPRGPIMAEEVEVPEYRKGFSAVEAPRGEDVHYVVTGRYSRVFRWKVRAPSYANIPALKPMLHECPLSDAPLTIASIDPCFSCTDRVLVVDVRSGRRFRVSLRRLARGGGVEEA